jgi:hypothetical protein
MISLIGSKVFFVSAVHSTQDSHTGLDLASTDHSPTLDLGA